MGNSNSEPSKDEVEGIKEISSGSHFFEIHIPSMGFGSATLFFLGIAMLAIFMCWRRKGGRRNTRRHNDVESFLYQSSLNNILGAQYQLPAFNHQLPILNRLYDNRHLWSQGQPEVITTIPTRFNSDRIQELPREERRPRTRVSRGAATAVEDVSTTDAATGASPPPKPKNKQNRGGLCTLTVTDEM